MKAKTPQELRQEFLDYCQFYCRYWERQDATSEDKLIGLVTSILTGIDGMAYLPPITMTTDVPDGAKQDAIDNECDWIEDGTVINPCDKLLHDLWGEMNRRQE